MTSIWLLGLSKPLRGLCTPAQTFGRAFTLIELLVVVAIIFLLVSILLPGLSQTRALAKQTVCLSNVRGIGLATQIYVSKYEQYPPAWQGSECRWMDLLKPFVSKKSGIYRCPSDRKQIAVTWDPEIVLSYGINTFRFADREHCFWYGVRAEDIHRPAGTIIFADCTPGKYYCGGGGAFSEPVVDVDYRHLHGCFCASFCDGHAEAQTSTRQEDWDASR
ncbi:MAG: type II secretion system protein [Planctomycetes bacterium]|nr:type II secretion system protein [Planctomycetota bacterium]